MRLYLKVLLVAAIAFVAVMPGAYGINFGATFGDSQGNRATASATLLGAENLDSQIIGSPGTAYAGISFRVDSANYMNCVATAVDKNQNKASVGLEATAVHRTVDGHPIFYANLAQVNSEGTFARQSVTMNAGTMKTTASSADQNGNRATAVTTVTDAIIYGTFIDSAAATPSYISVHDFPYGSLSGSTINSKSTVIDENQNKATSSTVTNSPFSVDQYDNMARITNALFTDHPNEMFAAQLWVRVLGTNMQLSSSATNQNGKRKSSSGTFPTTSETNLMSYGLLTSGVPSAYSGSWDLSEPPFL